MPSSAEYQKLLDEYKAFIDTPPVEVPAPEPAAKPAVAAGSKKPAEDKSPAVKRPEAVAKEEAASMEHEPTLAELARPAVVAEEAYDGKAKALKNICFFKKSSNSVLAHFFCFSLLVRFWPFLTVFVREPLVLNLSLLSLV